MKTPKTKEEIMTDVSIARLEAFKGSYKQREIMGRLPCFNLSDDQLNAIDAILKQ